MGEKPKMVENFKELESKPYLIALNQIETPKEQIKLSKNDKSNIKKTLKSLEEWGFNLSLPLACLGSKENSYRLLTGLPIYQVAVEAKLQRIWVFLIADKQAEAEKAVEQVFVQSKLNERVVESQDVTDFITFINDKKTDLDKLIKIPGIGDSFATKILANRPYSKEKLQEEHGKRSINWVKAYKPLKNQV
jgi:hypothetical protein